MRVKGGENMKVSTGCLWLGKEWEDAIRLSLKTPDCGIEEVWEYKNSTSLLDNEKILAGYRMWGLGNRMKKYKTKIPKKYNNFVKNLLNKGR